MHTDVATSCDVAATCEYWSKGNSCHCPFFKRWNMFKTLQLEDSPAFFSSWTLEFTRWGTDLSVPRSALTCFAHSQPFLGFGWRGLTKGFAVVQTWWGWVEEIYEEGGSPGRYVAKCCESLCTSLYLIVRCNQVVQFQVVKNDDSQRWKNPSNMLLGPVRLVNDSSLLRLKCSWDTPLNFYHWTWNNWFHDDFEFGIVRSLLSRIPMAL